MAKVIWRTGKVVLAVIIPLAVLCIIMFGIDVFSVARADLQDVDSAIPPELHQMQEVVIIHIGQKDFAQAEEELEQLWTKYRSVEGFVQSLHTVVEAYWKAGEVAAHQALCGRILTEFPDHLLAPVILGCEIRGYIKLKDMTGAEEKLEQLWTEYPSAKRFVQSLHTVVKAYWNADEVVAHQALCGRILTEFPDHSLAPMILGCEIRGCIKLKDMTGAEEKLEQLWTGYPSAERFVQKMHTIVETYWRAGEVAAHQALCSRILTEFPDHLLAPVILECEIRGCIKLKDMTGAEEKLEQLWTKHPSAPEFAQSLHTVVKAYWKAGDVAAHQALCDRFLTEFPDHSLAPVILGYEIRGCIKLKDMAGAEEKLEQLWTEYRSVEGFVQSLHTVVEAYRRPRDAAAHQALCGRILTEFPDHSLAPMILGCEIRRCITLKDMAGAEEKLEQLWTEYSSAPEFAQSLHTVVEAYWKADEVAAHQALCGRILTEFPDHSLAPMILGCEIRGCIKLKDTTLAEIKTEELFTKYNQAPLFVDAVESIGLSYYSCAMLNRNHGLDDSVEEDLEKALSIWARIYEIPNTNDTQMADLEFRSGVILAQELGRYQEGIDCFQEIIDNWPGYEHAWRAQDFVGRYYEKLRDSGGISAELANPKIEQAYKDLFEKYPESPPARSALIKLISMLRGRDQLESAVAYMEQFIEKYPDDDQADDMLYESGNVYEQIGLLDMAAYAYHNFIGTADVNDPRVPTAQQKLNDLERNN